MKIALVASIAVLTGCANLVPAEERAKTASDTWLCYAAVQTTSYHRQQVFEAELKRRGATCTSTMYSAAQAEEARRQAEMAAGAALILQSRPPPPVAPPMPLRCHTDRWGYTNCW